MMALPVRFVPDWIPGAGFKRLPPGTREDLHAFLHTPFEQVKKQMVGTFMPHLTSAGRADGESLSLPAQPYLATPRPCLRRQATKRAYAVPQASPIPAALTRYARHSRPSGTIIAMLTLCTWLTSDRLDDDDDHGLHRARPGRPGARPRGARHRRRQGPPPELRRPREASVPPMRHHRGHPDCGDDARRRPAQAHGGRRVQRVLHPQGLHGHGQHLVRLLPPSSVLFVRNHG